jgi:hypothetical protein
MGTNYQTIAYGPTPAKPKRRGKTSKFTLKAESIAWLDAGLKALAEKERRIATTELGEEKEKV